MLETDSNVTVISNGTGAGADSLDFSLTIGADVPTVPEPATLALLGIGLAGLGFSRRTALRPRRFGT